MGESDQAHPARDRDLAPVGALIGHPARAAMLGALADGRALPASELARHAQVKPATATEHLRRLVDGGLVMVRAQGRHRYHELAGPEIARALEALAQIAPQAEIRSLRQDRAAAAVAEARTCYDHLAGRLGVELRDRLLATGTIERIGDRDHLITDQGRSALVALGIDVGSVESSRRILARSCLDFTHRRPHLAGALATAITERMLRLGWVARGPGRGLRVHRDYQRRLDSWLPPG